ncbi:NnrU family protein [Acuticoccus sediminis]|uniref:NnrU family protein n=1 Tax=Acuticoccus sediminis TaxID=2184697 RepID=A0A8B2NNR2_9HYPH|nr:NnrU family protein [Acuticoccus sediminis]RAH99517.1 NnrU family protein [Acuticoccus sediminis]
MVLMLVGLVLFLGAHSLKIVPSAGAPLRQALGETAYKISYSIVSLIGLILLARGYSAWWAEGPPILYVPPAGMSHLALLLMLLAFIVLPAAYLPGHIRKTLKHPMLVAVKTWAVAHLLVNGDLPSVILFGAFLAWAVLDRISLKKRERAGLYTPPVFTPRWQADVTAVVIGLVVYGLFVWKLHLWLIGVSPLAMASAV